MSTQPRKRTAPEPSVNGLQPKITEDQSTAPDRYKLECPLCDEVGRYRFALLARRAFEEHVDENHPAAQSPLDQVRTLVDMTETDAGTWECTLGAERYVARQHSPGRFTVEVVNRRIMIDARLATLDDARITIGGHAKLVSSALVTAATIQLRQGRPAHTVPLE
ncbi:hypothetical protein [Streptomyces californicus]|uniref:hypothetical protein n=1 Tax=Streptomyces californicus TaxID=67351 RepID=UPI00296E71EB|nr:hypothetical protein [Streptomyces californicus]MDW4912550.1 hypothetical protein [Streptomyces californicus]